MELPHAYISPGGMGGRKVAGLAAFYNGSPLDRVSLSINRVRKPTQATIFHLLTPATLCLDKIV